MVRTSEEIVGRFLRSCIRKWREEHLLLQREDQVEALYRQWEEQEEEQKKHREYLIQQGKYRCVVCGDKIMELDGWGAYKLCSRLCSRISEKRDGKYY